MMDRPASPVTLAAGALATFGQDHRRCDDLWAAVEIAGDAGDREGAAAAFVVFDAAMRRHLDMEEQVLFPAFEKASGMSQGPTSVMRAEHQQMRSLLNQMRVAATGEPELMLDHGDTLMMLIQQHNVKEEGMLYPMCDAHLADSWPAIAARLARFG